MKASIPDLIKLSSYVGAELGAMEEKEYAILFTPEQLQQLVGELVEVDCRVCTHYCETNGCGNNDCNKGDQFNKDYTMRLWELWKDKK